MTTPDAASEITDEITADITADIAAHVEQPRPVAVPPLPPSVDIDLVGRGTLPIRHLNAPADGRRSQPAVMLLHGWTATADLNWFKTYTPLSERHEVVAWDHRGHGTGLRTKGAFTLEDCADDAIAVADALGIEHIIAVGYSMGGPIAQLMWRRHPDRVCGLVLCATAPMFMERRDERLSFIGLSGLAALARLTPAQARNWITDQVYLQRKAERWEPWAIEQASTHDWRMILEAGRALGNFSSLEWLGEIERPTSVIITVRDQVVSIDRQVKLIERIRHAEIFRLNAEHDAAVSCDRFVPTLLRAVDAVMV
jgi:3-oxoadipate enol-lactonase